VEYRAVQLEFPPQLLRVGEVAVVSEGHITLDVADDEGLEVFGTAAARGGVADVPDCDISRA